MAGNSESKKHTDILMESGSKTSQDDKHQEERTDVPSGVESQSNGASVEAEKKSEQTTPAPAALGLPGPFDSGFVPWIHAVGALAMWMNSWGLVNAYGSFQTYYELDLLSHRSPSDIAWIGSVQAFLLLAIGPLSGPVYDIGGFRYLVFVGNLLVVFGLMMTSLCNTFWEVLLAQGIVCGLGFGMLFTPAIAIIPQYFRQRKAFANGVAASGSGLGGVIYPIVLHRLIPRVGFPWAVRIIGFIALALGLFSFIVMRTKTPPGKMRKLVNTDFFHNKPIVVATAGGFLTLMALYIPVYYIETYALRFHIVDQNLSFYLVPILQAGSTVGRLVPSLLADKVGTLNLMGPICLGTSLLAFCWIAIKNEAGLIAFAILYGAFMGLILSLLPTLYPVLWQDWKVLGTIIGMGVGLGSFGVLIGTPISGAIVGNTGSWVGLQAFCGSVVAIAGVLFCIARYTKAGFTAEKI